MRCHRARLGGSPGRAANSSVSTTGTSRRSTCSSTSVGQATASRHWKLLATSQSTQTFRDVKPTSDLHQRVRKRYRTLQRRPVDLSAAGKAGAMTRFFGRRCAFAADVVCWRPAIPDSHPRDHLVKSNGGPAIWRGSAPVSLRAARHRHSTTRRRGWGYLVRSRRISAKRAAEA